MNPKPVFFDSSGTRHRRVKSFGVLFASLAAVAATLFVLSLLAIPFISPSADVGLSRVGKLIPGLPHSHEKKELAAINHARTALWQEVSRENRASARPLAVPTTGGNSEAPVVAAFYAPWQNTGISSLRREAGHLTHLMPDWLLLNSAGNGLDLSQYDALQNPANPQAEALARKNGVGICPVLSNAQNTDFDAARVGRLLNSPTAQRQLIASTCDWLQKNHYQGLNLDFENLALADSVRLPRFVAALGQSLRAAHLSLSVDVEANLSDGEIKALAAPCDFVVLMAYDQHSNADEPGPIAGFDWNERLVEHVQSLAPANKIVLGVGNYAYDWTLNGHHDPNSLTYQEALLRAQEAAGNQSPRHAVDFDPDSLNATYEYQDEAGHDHQVWMLDAASAYNQWKLAERAHLRGGALWVLGSEDPSLWGFFRRGEGRFSTEDLQQVSFPYEVTFNGQGEILRVAATAKTGERSLDFDEDGICTDQQYTRFPSATVLQRSGFSKRDLVLTFDDGPDPQWTPQILDILKQYGVKASFFVIGDNAEKYPALVRRIYAEGHDLGNHTFTHPNLGTASARRVELELNATQRAIESITGYSTRLFRPPYNADAEPQTLSEIAPIQQATNLGYLTIGEFIDPQDWNPVNIAPDGTQTPRTAANMIRDIERGADNGKGNIILLHDAGGDRAKTIQVLRTVLPALQKKGFRFVTVSALAGGRAALMPPISGHQKLLIAFDRVMFNVIFGLQWLISFGFIAAIVLGFARLGLVLPLALVARRRERLRRFDPQFAPLVSVLIAAYNEEKTIERTIRSVLESDYPHVEVIVVDDGSKDETSAVVAGAFGDEARVRLIRQANGGKASALNRALGVANGEIVVGFDADTQVAPDAISLLVRHFCDQGVAAVAGNVKVGNRLNTLTRWQAIEYVTSQNLDRRAYGLLNAITVVPGAIGAWRLAAVKAVGGYVPDTLAEDMDLTWRLRRAGWRIANETRAVAFTEAPDTLSTLFKQRFRWAYGTLQCLTKHRRALGRNGVFGRLMLPLVWVFQFALQWLAPLVDLQLLIAVASMVYSWWWNGAQHGHWMADPDTVAFLQKTGFFYAVFYTVELAGSAIAIRMDREDSSLLWWLFWQRFVYRQMLYVVIWKATWTALSGFRQGWNKLARKGTVSLPVSSVPIHSPQGN